MKYLIPILIAVFTFPSIFAQDDVLVKTDGTKYYLQVYDGETNEKVVSYYHSNSDWKKRLQVDDYFDGSGKQLWSFKATELYPGYFSINNHSEEISLEWSMMSWNWISYLTDADNRDPASELEMQFRFVPAPVEGYLILETIEKPTDGSLYGINYTPGADAFNVQDGFLAFSNVKSADITAENMANKVYRLVEFDPLKLFEESVFRGEDLLEANPNVPEVVRYNLFYTTEKARELIVFGTDAEVLAYQPILDTAIINFNIAVELVSVLDGARTFIDTIGADTETTTSFNSIVDNIDSYLNSDDVDFSAIDSVKSVVENAQSLVVAIVDAQAYAATLTSETLIESINISIGNAKNILASDTSTAEDYLAAITQLEDVQELIKAIKAAQAFKETLVVDTLKAGMDVSIDTAQIILLSEVSVSADYGFASSHLVATQDIVTEIVVATDLIDATSEEFADAKVELALAINEAIGVINTSGNTLADLELGLENIQAAIIVFQKALEAGDTPIILKNANFDGGSADWNWDTDTPSAVRPSTKGVDGSASMTLWHNADYQMKFYQSLSDIPDGVYTLRAMISTNIDGAFNFFAESGANVADSSITLEEGLLVQRELKITVVGGVLEFGVRGAGENNGLAAGSWVVLDNFELTWSSQVPVVNPEFVDGLNGYTNTGTTGIPYPSAKGVNGSESANFWNNADYTASFNQEITGLPNAVYSVSVSVMTQAYDSLFIFYGTDGVDTTKHMILQSTAHSKIKINVPVTTNSLEFGILGAGVDNSVPANRWLVIDQFEVSRLPNVNVLNSDFENSLTDWDVSGTDGAAYPENKGIDGSRSITCWSGSDFNISVSQTAPDLLNGSYAVSAMTKGNYDSVYVVFGESSGSISSEYVVGNVFAKTTALAEVTDGSLRFGIKGAGNNDSVPGSRWIVFDEVEVLLKSVFPVYVTPPVPPAQSPLSNIETSAENNEIVCWQGLEEVNIRSNEIITNYSVYSLTGRLVKKNQVFSNELSFPLNKGLYIVHVITESGFEDTQKIIVR